MQHRPKSLDKLVIHQDIGEHLIKLVSTSCIWSHTAALIRSSTCCLLPLSCLAVLLPLSQTHAQILHFSVQNFPKVESGDCPHTLFYGPPGAGKKTLILGLLRQIYGASAERLKVQGL